MWTNVNLPYFLLRITIKGLQKYEAGSYCPHIEIFKLRSAILPCPLRSGVIANTAQQYEKKLTPFQDVEPWLINFRIVEIGKFDDFQEPVWTCGHAATVRKGILYNPAYPESRQDINEYNIDAS
jgi:hypothetical protein